MIAGLILAGGASRRMGSPKPLLELDGETFLDHLIGNFTAHCDPVIVVLGHSADAIRTGARRIGEVRVVVNPDPELGQLSSLQCGLREVPSDVDGVLYTPADLPLVKPATIAALAAAAGDMSAHAIVAPHYQGRHGHPVCISRDLVAEFLALPLTATARDVIHRWRSKTTYVAVDDPGILRDIDDPETYRRLTGQ